MAIEVSALINNTCGRALILTVKSRAARMHPVYRPVWTNPRTSVPICVHCRVFPLVVNAVQLNQMPPLPGSKQQSMKGARARHAYRTFEK